MAHLLTALRLLLAAPVAVGLARPETLRPAVLLVMIGVAIATDLLDGVVARGRRTASPEGMLADHATDFVFVTSGLTGAAVGGHVPFLLPVLIAVAFTQYVVDSYALHRHKELRMSVLGRWNGILYFVPLVLVAASRLDAGGGRDEQWASVIGSLCAALVLSTVVSIVDRAVAPLRRSPR